MTVRNILKSLLCGSALALAASCSGGGGDNAPPPTGGPPPPGAKATFDKAPIENLTIAEIQQIIAQAVAEAQARGTPATIAITDRVGNVLAVFQMTGAPAKTLIRPGPLVDNAVNFQDNRGVQGLLVPSELTAIAKAITGSYLSSGGNAFSTRTASQIVQEHFHPHRLH